jgi:hypothetical protein
MHSQTEHHSSSSHNDKTVEKKSLIAVSMIHRSAVHLFGKTQFPERTQRVNPPILQVVQAIRKRASLLRSTMLTRSPTASSVNMRRRTNPLNVERLHERTPLVHARRKVKRFCLCPLLHQESHRPNECWNLILSGTGSLLVEVNDGGWNCTMPGFHMPIRTGRRELEGSLGPCKIEEKARIVALLGR